MSGTLVRTILAMVLLLSTPAVCFAMVFIGYESNLFDYSNFAILTMISLIVTAAYFMAGWIWVWKEDVRWVEDRKRKTKVMTICTLIASVVFGGAVIGVSNETEGGMAFGGIFYLFVWTVGSVLIWRESPTERVARMENLGVDGVSCPACGYNMTGLKTATCPECGKVYTVDQIVAHVIESKRDVLAGE